jgi:hypothetical protein
MGAIVEEDPDISLSHALPFRSALSGENSDNGKLVIFQSKRRTTHAKPKGQSSGKSLWFSKLRSPRSLMSPSSEADAAGPSPKSDSTKSETSDIFTQHDHMRADSAQARDQPAPQSPRSLLSRRTMASHSQTESTVSNSKDFDAGPGHDGNPTPRLMRGTR